jgi:hypothetical protein
MKLMANCTTLPAFLQTLTRLFTQNIREAYDNILSLLFLTETQFGGNHQEIHARLMDKKVAQTYRFSQFASVFLNLAS